MKIHPRGLFGVGPYHGGATVCVDGSESARRTGCVGATVARVGDLMCGCVACSANVYLGPAEDSVGDGPDASVA